MGLALLDGIRVIDLTSTLSGPYASLLLADLGAEVIKLEAPGGDTARDLGPRVSADLGAVFVNANRNKRSVVLDLRSPQGRADLKRLTDTAQAFVHNMRPDAAVRCGADAATLRDGHPELVHCAIRGYGVDGPYRDRPAYDDIIQAAAGIAAQQAWMAGRPEYIANAMADKVCGMTAAMAVAAALRQQAATGAGCAIEVPMYETMAAFGLLEHLWGRTFVPARGEARYPRISSPARRPFRTGDGWLSVVVYTNQHWSTFFEMIGRPELIALERFATLGARTDNLDELFQLVEETLQQGTTDEWVAKLTAAGIPASRYAEVDDLFEDPHLAAVGFFHHVDHPSEGELLQIPTPLTVDGRRAGPGRPAPRLGADTAEIMGGLDDPKADG